MLQGNKAYCLHTLQANYDYSLHVLQDYKSYCLYIYKLVRTVLCTCYKIIKTIVCTHYKPIRTAVCMCYMVINSTFGTQSHSPSVSTFVLQLVFFLPVTSHFITIFFHIQILWIVPICNIWHICELKWLFLMTIVNGQHNTYGYNTFCYCLGIC